ncbi:hypothetical protein N0V82_002817 [Gnomoniopsis sp. IMI 355080]|nr:hypothetical protein N0V82_002817 [Gnomoniopsis sp. IMI 355080]
MAGASGRPRGRPRKNPGATCATTPINSFTRVSKQATGVEKNVTDITPITPSARKRKAARSPEPEEVALTPSQRDILPCSASKSSKKARLQASEPIIQVEELSTPSTPRPKSTKKRALSPTPEESPRTKEAGSLFKRLRIDSTPRAARKSSPLITHTTRTSASTPATSVAPDSDSENDADASNLTTPEPDHRPLPQELLDLVSLHVAFLKTIVLHYAHNGTNTPVDLREISQPVSVAWGKRRISLADVRRLVGVMDVTDASPFSLVNYGLKKVCVELRDGYQGRPLDEPGLARVFENNLWDIWERVKDITDDDLSGFMMSLPKAPVQSCESAAKASAMFAKGHRAMEELNKGIAARQDAQEAAKTATPSTSTDSGPTTVKLSLLERLRLKEEQLASLTASGPTPAELERKAALQRAGDIAAVISMLAKSASSAGMGGRVSFTMPALLQKLKDSLRVPVSKEEGAACVRLLASEVAPEWLRIVAIGAKENVVITVGRAPSSGMVVERVKILSS